VSWSAAEGFCRPGSGVRNGTGPLAWGPPSLTGLRRTMNGAGWVWSGGPLPLETVAGAPVEAAVRAQGFPRLHHLERQK
jgi:hypothetical protein